ncbi:MAG: thiamine-phosphate pyrophosphorylase [bacterium]
MNKKAEIFRILDANFNRSKEGLRVIEDILRFSYLEFDKKNQKEENISSNINNSIIKKIRFIRHSLSNIIDSIYFEFLKNRDIKNDSGKIFNQTKYENINEILISNFKRVEESLRVIEELMRLISLKKSDAIKKLRFNIYELEKKTFITIIK